MMHQVLLLCEYPTLNGGERSMLATLDGVRAAGFSPVVMGPPAGPLPEKLADRGIEHLSFSCHTADGSRLPQNRLREALAEVLCRRRPALLHANSLAMGRLSGPVAAHYQLPSIAHLRDIIKLSAQVMADLSCHGRLLAVSHATRRFHVASGVAAEKIHVVHNGVDFETFRPRPTTGYLHHELGLPAEARLVGTIGQISLRKGQDVLLRAAARLADLSPEVHYVIVGERHSEKDESQSFEKNLRGVLCEPLAGRVHFLGRRDDVDRLLNELTLLVHPARQEPLGRVLLESAAAGLAVVATDVGGTPEIFPPELTAARLVAPDDIVGFATAMNELLGNQSLRRRLAAAARCHVEQQFDIRQATDNLLQHYRSTMMM